MCERASDGRGGGGDAAHATPGRMWLTVGVIHTVSRVVHQFCGYVGGWTGCSDRVRASSRRSRASIIAHCPCAKTIQRRTCRVPTNEERIARLRAMRAESLLGGGEDRIDQQHAPRQADGARATRAAARPGFVRRARRVRHARVVDFGLDDRHPRRRRRHRPRDDRRPARLRLQPGLHGVRRIVVARPTRRRSARSWTSR